MKMKCLFFMVMFLVAGSFLVGCNVETAAIPIYEIDVVYTADAPYVPSCLPVVPVIPDNAKSASDCIELTQEQYRLWTVEELGGIIVASGIFWEEWWQGIGRFSNYNLGSWKDIREIFYSELLPTSGFGSLCDIRYYLLQYYTDAWVHSMLTLNQPPFIEHNNVLFVHVTRICSSYPDWDAASHVLINQVGYLAYVKSTVSLWSPEVNEITDATITFIFVDGRINRSSMCLRVKGWCPELIALCDI